MRGSREEGQPQGLISVLLDKAAAHGDRTDAAADLAAFDEAPAEAALASIVVDAVEDVDLLDYAGEALATIWCRKGRVDMMVLARMIPAARAIAEALVREKSPELLK